MNYESQPDGSLPEYQGKVKCPECGTAVAAFRVLFVGPSTITDNDWACDGCWNAWKRNKKPVKEGKESLTGSEWFYDFMVELGAVDLDNLKDQKDKSLDKLRDKLERTPSKGADDKLQSILDKINTKKPKK